jgi:hypothetical protein
MKRLLIRIGAAGATIGMASIVGLSGIASAQSFGYGGGWSNNWNNGYPNFNSSRINNNSVSVNNLNSQTAVTGMASVSGNRFGGSAITGDASNFNSTRTDINISNGGDWGGYPYSNGWGGW